AAAAVAAQSWSGTTGAELRGRAARASQTPPAVAGDEAARSGGVSWLPTLLAAALGVLVIAGVVKHRRAAQAAGPEPPDIAAAEPGRGARGAGPHPRAYPPRQRQYRRPGRDSPGSLDHPPAGNGNLRAPARLQRTGRNDQGRTGLGRVGAAAGAGCRPSRSGF